MPDGPRPQAIMLFLVPDMNSNQLRRDPSRKHQEILAAATARFGRDGYEHTKWADVASDVGVGPTALYHYFESKLHCLYVIMDEAIEDFRDRFVALTTGSCEPLHGLAAVLQDCFDLTEQDVLRNRVLVCEQVFLGIPRTSAREEEARLKAHARARDLEFAWATFLADAMRQGAIPESDPRLLTRAILGLYNSIWQWYRRDGIVTLETVSAFFTERALGMIGVGPGGVIRPSMVA
jgi:TetR/AcrR family transcriptional regulator, cholesterol catabolism regulator